jgi:hypothetical protein
VLEDVRVFGWGETSFGQLVLGEDNGDGTFAPQEADALAPVEIAGLPDTVVSVKGGARWAVALTEDGDVWLWGPNDEGPTGGLDGDLAAESDGSFFPTKLAALDAETVIEIQTGPNHLIAVTEDRRFLTFVAISDGRLGCPTDGLTTEPAPVDLDGDAAPRLLAATPGDNARDVAPEADVELLFPEPLEAGDGAIRFVNRGDPEDVIAVEAADEARVSIDGVAVTIDPQGLFRPGARYAVEIDGDAFLDASGQAFAELGPDDASSFDFRIDADAPAIIGSDGIDRIRGTDGDDLIWTGGRPERDRLRRRRRGHLHLRGGDRQRRPRSRADPQLPDRPRPDRPRRRRDRLGPGDARVRLPRPQGRRRFDSRPRRLGGRRHPVRVTALPWRLTILKTVLVLAALLLAPAAASAAPLGLEPTNDLLIASTEAVADYDPISDMLIIDAA